MTIKNWVQGRFAETILKMAESAERPAAIRLVEGLANDTPATDATNRQAELHRAAIRSYLALAAVLKDSGPAATISDWNEARAATEKWRAMI